MKVIYSFKDYREFLQAYYLEQKNKSGGFSYAKFAKRAGVHSPNYLKLVIDGKKNLTVSNIHQFSRALGLRGNEYDYFEALVLRDQGTGGAARKYYEARLHSIRSSKPRRALNLDSSALLAKWYFPALLLYLSGRAEIIDENSLDELAEKLSINRLDLDSAVSRIRKEGLITAENGSFRLNQDHWLLRDKQSSKTAHAEFLASQLVRSGLALKRQYASGARFFSHTFTVSEESFLRNADKIQDLLAQITSNDEDAVAENQVAQLNIQLFRVI